MSFNFTQLDHVIEQLQKKLEPGSPPVMERGHLGIWRNLRGARTFLEVVPGNGKYNFNGKSYKGGRVLIGPPSLVNIPISNVPDSVWDALSGSGTKRTFSSSTPEGIASLKSSIRNALKQDDTRVVALETNDLTKLVQIARSARFTDDEIKEALAGKVFQDAIGGEVLPFKPRGKAQKPKTPKETKPTLAVVPDKPTPESPAPSPGKMTADGSFAPMIEALTSPDAASVEGKRDAADRLAELADTLKEEFLGRQIKALALGLHTDDFTVKQVVQEIRELVQHRQGRALAAMTADQMDKMEDKAAAKETITSIKQHVATQPDAAHATFVHDALVNLAKRVNDPVVKVQIIQLAKTVQSRKLFGNSVVLRVLAILRLLLAFIPG